MAKIGRPTKYRPEMCEEYIELSKKGNCLTEIASEWNVDKNQIYAWMKKYPEFHRSVKRGREHLKAWHHKLFKNIMAGKIKGANVTAAIWLSRNAAFFTENPQPDFDEDDQIDGLIFE